MMLKGAQDLVNSSERQPSLHQAVCDYLQYNVIKYQTKFSLTVFSNENKQYVVLAIFADHNRTILYINFTNMY